MDEGYGVCIKTKRKPNEVGSFWKGGAVERMRPELSDQGE